MTLHSRLDEVAKFNGFLGSLPHPHKLIIAGNHDACFESQPQASRAALPNAVYLQDEFAIIEGVIFYSSSWQPEFRNMAFNLPRGKALQEKWDIILADTDVLITHPPPWGQNDKAFLGSRVGCQNLIETVKRLKIPLHIFGHIHEAHGQSMSGQTIFANVSIFDLLYMPTRRAFVF